MSFQRPLRLGLVLACLATACFAAGGDSPRSEVPPWSWGVPRTTTPRTAATSPSTPPTPASFAGPSKRALVRALLGSLVPTVAPDTMWAATVERQRCIPAAGRSPVGALVARLAESELRLCDPALLWDASMPTGEETLRQVLAGLTRPYVLARTPSNTAPPWLFQPPNPPYPRRRRGHWREVFPPRDKCRHVVALVDDIMSVGALLGNLSEPRVVVVTRSPKWRIRDYLASPVARSIRNLLVVHDRTWRVGSAEEGFPDLDLYTHRLFVDSLGYSGPHVLTAWRCDRLTRPHQTLFPLKMVDGFAGHQFSVSASDTPPFMYKTIVNNDGELKWDGVEIRLLALLAERLNFTIAVREAAADDTAAGGSAVRVVSNVVYGGAEMGAGGIYMTQPRMDLTDFGLYHTQDCAAFITLASIALPRYRAIMGPFQWTVWLALTLTYFFAILPLVYSHAFSLRVLIKHPGQIENMFWYVFGTFTNAFSFKGRDSWTRTNRTSTRMIIGWYWVFSIIVTACYTGCIISFIAFPAFPSVIDYIWQLWDEGYTIGTLRTDGWSTWFLNSSDPLTDKLLEKMETVPTVWDGIVNITRAYFWRPYSFLGSRLYLEHVVQTNYTAESKRSLMHITRECLVPFWVGIIFPKDASYSERFNQILMRSMQTGITEKLRRDVAWDVMRSSAKGKSGRTLVQVSTGSALHLPPPEERMLTLDDTQGMFLLLGAGFAIAGLALFVENMTGRIACCRKRCQPGPRRRSSVGSIPPELMGTPVRSAVNSMAATRPGGGSSRRNSSARRPTLGSVSALSKASGLSCGNGVVATVTRVDLHETPGRLRVQSLLNKMVTAVAAANAFRRASLGRLGLAWTESSGQADRGGEGGLAGDVQHLFVEDQVLHLSNAWSDRTDRSEASYDAYLRVQSEPLRGDSAEVGGGGRCRRGSIYPVAVPSMPSTPELQDQEEGTGQDAPWVDGEHLRWRRGSGQSSVFGSVVHHLEETTDQAGAGEDDDAVTYIPLHSSSESVHDRAGSPPALHAGCAPGTHSPPPVGLRPQASKLTHRRRSSFALSSMDLQQRSSWSQDDEDNAQIAVARHHDPPGSFPETPNASPSRHCT